ncbi:drug resistance transporter [Levilactobacillus senmaizukei DSM 21775 = NBRC 103853]|uniref:Bcr/CflA family efflux transporter n=1 Tax=Levilactobacillus senmaizukei DSM 21775 = NBRC 103853 TaxID=1423803 RepID=A0A0R2DPR9_9LACO|nr:multidrug effflux MFS transporter [Levilactobacillus senmaizukei]KRN01949.1 drug resistance transporter [Levilactobacillus senmaizukei DSM 21775 = NBRC 103853]
MKNVHRSAPSLGLIITLVGFPQISESIFTPVLPQLQKNLQVSASRIQLTMSWYFIAFAFGVLIWGQLADRFGRRPTMLAGIVIYLIGNLGLSWSPTFDWLLLSRLVQAFGASAGSVITQTMMRESFSGVTGAKIFAKTSAAMALAPALGPLIGGCLQLYWGVHSVFTALVILAITIGGYAWTRLPETQPVNGEPVRLHHRQLCLRLLRDPVVWTYGLLIGGINGILFSYYAEAPFIFMTHFGFSSVQYGWLGMVLAAASLLGAVIVNHLLTWWAPEQLTWCGLVLSVIGGGSWLLTANWQLVIPMLLAIFVTFLGLNITLPNALNRALVGYETVMGSASGWFSLAYYLLVSAITWGMSGLHNGQILSLPWYVLALCMGMLLVFSRLRLTQRRSINLEE